MVFNTASGNQQNQFICERTGNTGRTGLHKEANHSIRKATVRKLQKAGISNDKIAAVTGHHNSHYEIMQQLTCKTISILVASYQKHVHCLLPYFSKMLFSRKWCLLVLNTTFQTALCTLILQLLFHKPACSAPSFEKTSGYSGFRIR